MLLESSEQSVTLATDSPLSADFGDLEAKVHRVEVGGFPLENFITPTGLVSLRGHKTQSQRLKQLQQIRNVIRDFYDL